MYQTNGRKFQHLEIGLACTSFLRGLVSFLAPFSPRCRLDQHQREILQTLHY
mgnify:CR=1 FL=1